MSKPNLITMIFLLLTITSCTTVVKLPLPALPDYPKFSQQELDILKECTKCIPIIRKLGIKDKMCRGSIKEHRAIIEATQ